MSYKSKILITASLVRTNGDRGSVWVDIPIDKSEWEAMNDDEREEMCNDILTEKTKMKYKVNTDYMTLMAHGLT